MAETIEERLVRIEAVIFGKETPVNWEARKISEDPDYIKRLKGELIEIEVP